MAKYLKSLNKFKRALVVIVANAILLAVSSILFYFIENGSRPDKFSSIPEAMWWSVTTPTKIGYGGKYPLTSLGKQFVTFNRFLIFGCFALIVMICWAGVSSELKRKKDMGKYYF